MIHDKHSSEYLYGDTLEVIAIMPYKEALLYKVILGNVLINELVRLDNMEDSHRILAVSKAITFNRELLKELKMSDVDIKEHLSVLINELKG